ncbi:MAG TPA: threonine synthase [Candidatus Polarisedimenticolaceae bacterium]|nr:threonine synthase [Candidatus Polarisedimenticolaceae bacterium]
MPSTLEWLECSRCHVAYDVAEPRNLCRCGGILLARYRLEEAARSLTRESLSRRPTKSLWRYEEVLPGSDDPVTLGEGGTPLLPLRFVGQAAGFERLYLKDESLNPTGSFKARGMACAITMARRLGVRRVALPSAGNAGSAAAAYGALAGLAVDVFLPDETPEPMRLEAAVCGAALHLVRGDIAVAGATMRAHDQAKEWFDLSTLREPYRCEGKKTLGYEIAEQLGWTLPDAIVYPTGGGTGLVGMWKAFEEMEQLGLIEGGKRPRMVAVQAEGCAPIVEAFTSGAPKAAPWDGARTFAAGLRVPAPLADVLILQAIRESGGVAVAVTDAQMAKAQVEMARGEGIFACPEGAATLVAAKRLLAEGFLSPSDRVVIFNTASGLKIPRIPGVRVP